MIRNTAIQGSLSILFAVLVLIVLGAAVVTCIKAVRGTGSATTEEEFHASEYFAARGLFSTDVEKQLQKVWDEKLPPKERAHAHH